MSDSKKKEPNIGLIALLIGVPLLIIILLAKYGNFTDDGDGSMIGLIAAIAFFAIGIGYLIGGDRKK